MMRPIEQIQAINEQANGPGVWSSDQARHNEHCGCVTPAPKPASEHVALQASINNGTTQIFMIDGVEYFHTI